MNTNDLGILNSLVTFASENIPGGLSDDEQAVAKRIGNHTIWGDTLKVAHPIPIATKKADRIHYLNRDAIHQTVCGLPTDNMERYFGINVLTKKVCADCHARQNQAANL